jgi:hypothetical protein
MNNAPMPDLVAELDILVSSADLQEAWEAERSLIPLPKIEFTAEGRRVVMHFCSDHGSLPGIQEIKRSFTIAMHRKSAFPRCKIHWPN